MLLTTILASQLTLPPFLMKTEGSCEEGNLAFQTLRISKIPLESADPEVKLEARFLLYLNEDGTYLGRYTENQVLSCHNGPQGETCSLKPLKTEKFSGSWIYENENLTLSDLGEGQVASYNNIPILKFHFSSENFPKIQGQDKTGWMIKINIDQYGKTAQSHCE